MLVSEVKKQDKVISFGMTSDRLCARMKTVTRRYWYPSYKESLLTARRLGNKIYAATDWKENGIVLGELNIVLIDETDITKILQSDVNLEGYPELTPDEFLSNFFGDKKQEKGKKWYRIEFEITLYKGHFKPLKSSLAPSQFKVPSDYEVKFKDLRAYMLAFDLMQTIPEPTLDDYIIWSSEHNVSLDRLRYYNKKCSETTS